VKDHLATFLESTTLAVDPSKFKSRFLTEFDLWQPLLWDSHDNRRRPFELKGKEAQLLYVELKQKIKDVKSNLQEECYCAYVTEQEKFLPEIECRSTMSGMNNKAIECFLARSGNLMRDSQNFVKHED
jgi:hypothetical protein